ncbi:MAG TPA: hypothetical protein VFJ90_05865, partial [Candidatus Didemnitutus sp.]|nr:hypothetical protein [Candidatus Didemnitutus sp.]
SLGLSLAALASDDPVSVPRPVDAGSRGLLGETYTHLGYSYVDTNHSNVDAHSFDFSLNSAVYHGADTLLEYNYTQSEPFAGGHAWWQNVLAGARGYTSMGGFKPYLEGGLGWAWAKAPVIGSDNSWAWFAGVGAEVTVARDITVTPFIRYTDAPGIDDSDKWDFGVKGNYWINSKFAVTANVSVDDDQDWTIGAGVNFQF